MASGHEQSQWPLPVAMAVSQDDYGRWPLWVAFMSGNGNGHLRCSLALLVVLICCILSLYSQPPGHLHIRHRIYAAVAK